VTCTIKIVMADVMWCWHAQVAERSWGHRSIQTVY